MTLNRVKLGRAAIFLKYLASVVSLIFPPKTLIWDKITFSASNLLNLADLMVKYLPDEEYLQNKLPILFFLFDLLLLNVKISRAYN